MSISEIKTPGIEVADTKFDKPGPDGGGGGSISTIKTPADPISLSSFDTPQPVSGADSAKGLPGPDGDAEIKSPSSYVK